MTADKLDLEAVFRESQIGEVLDVLERELIGLAPVKARIHDIAALLLVDKLRASLGWIDALRHFVPETETLYSWWSYRNRDWAASDRGRRLDHVWVTPHLAKGLRAHHIARDARNWQPATDHVPVTATLEL